jgi:hypothetical protein
MHAARSAIPETSPLAKVEFRTIRDRLMKIGARVVEHIARIRIYRKRSTAHTLTVGAALA